MGSEGNMGFLFNESFQITFLLQLFYNGEEGRASVCFDATIKLENNVITLKIYLSDSFKKNKLSNMLTTYKKKDFKIRNDSIDNYIIELKIIEDIRFTHFYTEKGKHICSMTLKNFYYSYKGTERLTTYRLNTTASTLLSPYLTGLSVIGNRVIGAEPVTFESSCYGLSFYMYRDKHHVYVQTEGDIDILLRTLSFFFCIPIEYDMVYSYDEEGNSHIEVSTTQYNIQATKRNEMLGYLFLGDVCLDHLFDFIDIIKSHNAKSMTDKMIESYIGNYVRAEFLDDISKLLLYTSILEKMAKVGKKEDAYNKIHHLLISYHIDIEKINDGVYKKELKNEEKENIENFIQLRNFFVHHLGSTEAESFLSNSKMLFYMKLVITILLLKKLGISEAIFDKSFHNISVFNKNIKESNYISNMLNANES